MVSNPCGPYLYYKASFVSAGGNCNTVLVANIYGEAAHLEETVRWSIKNKQCCLLLSDIIPISYCLQLSTLRFASRMKRIPTDPAVVKNMDPAVSSHVITHTTKLL